MTQPVWSTDRIQVDVSGCFTTHHRLQAGAAGLGELTLPATRREGMFHAVDGRDLTVLRTSWWRSEHELREGSTTLARARPRGFFQSQIVIQFGAGEYVLERLGFFNRGWRLLDPAGVALVEVNPQGVFKRGAFLDVLAPVEVGLLVFSYYLVYVRWQEESAAAVAAAS
ncbi:MAG: hypothetical protein JXD18_13305 [Anaerolineae bacterium]|nr:hypothetical protein [Anaerolineae bacterium]